MKFAIFLSGCGQLDGSETHEVILTLLSLSQNNIEYDSYSIDTNFEPINHITQEKDIANNRNCLIESARLVRGKVKDIKLLNPSEYDALIFPGGSGAITHLSEWDLINNNLRIEKMVQQKAMLFAKNHKPIGFICIAPIIASCLYTNPRITLGNDPNIIEKAKKLGVIHEECTATDIVTDLINNIVSTPANMVRADISEIYIGIKNLVYKLKELSQKP
jgi:enhancing lycopene biosynthesis protein 2